VHLKDVTASRRSRIPQGLTSRISMGLETEFSQLPNPAGPNVGIILRERRRHVTREVPGALLTEAVHAATAREAIRVRIKGHRGRMLFQARPTPLSKHIARAPARGGMFGFGRGGRGQRRR
jgi:hypothetical protein